MFRPTSLPIAEQIALGPAFHGDAADGPGPLLPRTGSGAVGKGGRTLGILSGRWLGVTVCLLTLALLNSGYLAAQTSDGTATVATSATASATNTSTEASLLELADVAEVRDALLLLDAGPVHLRLHILVGGRSPQDARRELRERLFQELDVNRDGQLSRDEAQRSPLLREKQRKGAAEFIASIGADLSLKPRELDKRLEQFGGETVTYRQNTTTSENDDAVYSRLDENSDGTVNIAEMSNAIDLLLAVDRDDDECVTLDEFAPETAVAAMPIAVAPVPATTRPAAVVSGLLRDTHQRLLPAQLIQQYDKNRDRQLSAEELGWTPERVQMIDSNRDGRLTVGDLAGISQTPVDVELVVDVARTGQREMLRVLDAASAAESTATIPDQSTVTLRGAVISLSARDVDPFEASMAIALRTFNELDQDANGYLDRDETAVRERFERGIFDQIDADGDDKIFVDEMKAFITSRGEPVATTCQITVYDEGAGFFSALDQNGDRRLSMREMKAANQTLARMQRDADPGLRKDEPSRRYRIEFVRGVFNPFGSTDRPTAMPAAAQVAAVRPRAVGPVWFQRWDRNNDGDITWREFLGPRDVFEQLDADRDEMIDPREAASARGPARPAAQVPPPATSSAPGQPTGTAAQPEALTNSTAGDAVR